VKNFNPNWTQEEIMKHFSAFGEIVSCVVMSNTGKDGQDKSFAFICYDRADDKAYGPNCASKAVNELHDKVIDEFKLYVQPAIPLEQRLAQVQREQQRFKNSKKKCNLFVKGFPTTFTVEDL
jgi:RNA recognition motif-containing protein